MNKRIVTLLCGLFMLAWLPLLRAQAIDSVFDYYPMAVGNRWIYNVVTEPQAPGRDPSAVITITMDTVMPNGHKYWKFSTSWLFSYSLYQRIDSATGSLVTYDVSHGRDTSLSIWSNDYQPTIAQVFGMPTPVRLYSAVRSSDSYDQRLAYGIGPIYLEYPDPDPSVKFATIWTLLGASINGTNYGAISDVGTDAPATHDGGPELSVTGTLLNDLRFSFALPARSRVRLTLTDLRGDLLPMFDGEYDAGRHTFDAHPAGLPNGFYLARLQTDNGVAVRRVLLAR